MRPSARPRPLKIAAVTYTEVEVFRRNRDTKAAVPTEGVNDAEAPGGRPVVDRPTASGLPPTSTTVTNV